MKMSKDLLLVLAFALMTSGCYSLQAAGILKPETTVSICKDVRLMCALGSGVDIRAAIACAKMVPLCDAVSPASPDEAAILVVEP